ncbi:hypothetical protein GUJ93_ZPchr0004g39728 [Zizania palustris]|uniref:Uncharacterized protein n=1 Tax=Zizania palustris TaxID=103762 RepID=A0A8J5SIM2_ZIZPA|nr:hypothetical protein GUJ93_ZPchr0004g39728 [Zizania palustris]
MVRCSRLKAWHQGELASERSDIGIRRCQGLEEPDLESTRMSRDTTPRRGGAGSLRRGDDGACVEAVVR